jgi:hypothetical protein
VIAATPVMDTKLKSHWSFVGFSFKKTAVIRRVTMGITAIMTPENAEFVSRRPYCSPMK